MMVKKDNWIFALLTTVFLLTGCNSEISLDNQVVKLSWSEIPDGYQISALQIRSAGEWYTFGKGSGKMTIIFSEQKPDQTPLTLMNKQGDTIDFPEKFVYVYPKYQRATTSVPMNVAGKAYTFYPDLLYATTDSIVFEKELEIGRVQLTYRLDENFPNDICVRTKFIPSRKGYYSVASVSLCTLNEQDLSWGVIPGYFQGKGVNNDFLQSYVYAQGLPPYPVLCRESTLTNPMAVLTDKMGKTCAVIVEPGQESERYTGNENLHDKEWKIALSHMNRDTLLSPTAYHPVLGEKGSWNVEGDTLRFDYRFTLQDSDWFDVYKHSVYDVFEFGESLDFKRTSLSLTDRVLSMLKYVNDDKKSFWQTEFYQGKKMGAQAYMSGVTEAENDAIKNSDIGAVWMLASLTGNENLKENRLPYIRNFKIAQQHKESDFFQGVASGQYYLTKKKKFVEEWGNHFEPIGLTYYTLIDIGNILLFQPDDKELKEKLIVGAERLLSWQKQDGSWPMAFDKDSHKPIFNDLQDYRPTFYGMYVAYRITGDLKYLQSAVKGADWYVKNAVYNGYFTGVCGDVRFVNDFATAQSAQALLDIYDATSDETYKDAAISIAKMYATSIFTYPIPDKKIKTARGRKWEDWQLSQVGLGFEHGGSIGSAVDYGPILLTGHAGMFIRIYRLTGESLFLDMARMGALGRDAFINTENKVASYYWSRFDDGPGNFPHHAWWQVGWIVDYLVAEAELRSEGKIAFPRGFITPKVGPHQTLAFTEGVVNGHKASLALPPGWIKLDNPNIDYLFADDKEHKIMYLILMNQQAHQNFIVWKLDSGVLKNKIPNKEYLSDSISIEPWGIKIIELCYK